MLRRCWKAFAVWYSDYITVPEDGPWGTIANIVMSLVLAVGLLTITASVAILLTWNWGAR